MAFELLDTDHNRVLPLFAALDHHLIIRAVVEGTSPGRIYVDDASRPRSAFLVSAEGYFVAGSPDDEDFNHGLGRLAAGRLFPELGEGEYGFDVHYAPAAWETRLPAIFPTEYPLIFGASYYRFRGPTLDWRARLPAGYELRPVDRHLLARHDVQHLDVVRQKIAGNWPSMDTFLALGFGFCLLHGGSLVSECLADCASGDRCEIGISTVPAYRRRGFGALTVAATVDHCLQRGYTDIGWHTADNNLGSIRTAGRAGFARVRGYPIFWACADEFRILLAQGAVHLTVRHEYRRAAEFFTMAFERGRAEARHHFLAACAWAGAGERRAALHHLHLALGLGFADLERLQTEPLLAGLHDDPDWPRPAAGDGESHPG